ncbi:MAG: type IV pilus twitching motility protein PilT [Pyrinomonadaceae bacterium]
MEKLNEYLQTLLSTCSYELHLEPNKTPYLVSGSGTTEVANSPLLGTQISMLVFPLIPSMAKQELPNKPEIEFVHHHNLGNFNSHVKKTPAGFNVTIRPMLSEVVADETDAPIVPPKINAAAPPAASEKPAAPKAKMPDYSIRNFNESSDSEVEIVEPPTIADFQNEINAAPKLKAETNFNAPKTEDFASPAKPANSFAPKIEMPQTFASASSNPKARARMDKLFYKMAEVGASDLHLSTSMPPLIRKDGKIAALETDEQTLTPEAMKELLTSIMPAKNQEEFDRRHDTDFAYQIEGLARFRANIFMDRKGMGGVFRIIPSKILTVEDLGLSKAILDLCSLSKGLVVVTGPTGSGKSTTLCAMVDHINRQREEHLITIEDPIEFVHDNKKCLVNQREVHNHTDSFKDALRAALREDPDILLVGEMRDLETISIAIETAETGHLVFGTLHTTTAPSTVDRIIDQFPADRQQQIRVMLSESLKGVIAQTLLPKKGGGRIAALEILIVTPAISNLIREGKTFQIPSAMQTGKKHGMVMLNDALMELVQKGIVEPRDAYLKSVEKTGFEALLDRNGFKL